MHPKAQHYVPQFYLRNFAVKRRKQFFICCYDKAAGKTLETNIKNIAQETKFYDFNDDEGEQKSIEAFFSDIETASQAALEVVCSKPSANTVSANKTVLANFIASQMSRTTVFRAEHLNMLRGANARLQDDGIEFPVPTENELKQHQAVFIVENTPIFADILVEMKWVLTLNQTGKPYWTSDHPIIKYNPHKPEFAGNIGLLSKGIQLHFPLSPCLALTICDPQEYAGAEPEVMAILPNVEFNNSGQVLYSRQYLFSIDDDFQLAGRMILENPTLGDPDRPRVIVS